MAAEYEVGEADEQNAHAIRIIHVNTIIQALRTPGDHEGSGDGCRPDGDFRPLSIADSGVVVSARHNM
jgi:hypothetical protein